MDAARIRMRGSKVEQEPSEIAERQRIIDSLAALAAKLGRPPSRAEFLRESGMTEWRVLQRFDSWNNALDSAGLQRYTRNLRLPDEVLLEDWAQVVREMRSIPTLRQYQKLGSYSPDVLKRRAGSWSAVPDAFREFAAQSSGYEDVVELLPVAGKRVAAGHSATPQEDAPKPGQKHRKLTDRPTYGDRIDFRGLRHAPVNEQGVVFLFGMVADELGYSVEGVQTGFPDCEAKRKVKQGRWQRVRIEFEFESANYVAHGHPLDGCDVLVCWKHNWPDCPANIEVLELSQTIQLLPRGE